MASIEYHRAPHHAGDVRAAAHCDFFGELLFPNRCALEELDLDELMAEQRFVNGLLETVRQPLVPHPDEWRKMVR